jgi:hypothetical protein
MSVAGYQEEMSQHLAREEALLLGPWSAFTAHDAARFDRFVLRHRLSALLWRGAGRWLVLLLICILLVFLWSFVMPFSTYLIYHKIVGKDLKN